MTGTQVATVDQDDWWDRLWRRAGNIATTKMIPKQLQGNQEATMAALVVLHEYGMPATVLSIKQLHLFPDGPEPSAQMIAGLLEGNGYRTRWGVISDTRAEVSVRRPDDTEWEGPFSYTIELARTSGALDEWVEHRVEDGKWPDGNKKYRTEKFLLGQDGVDIPGWAAAEVRAGNKKRLEAWRHHPDDMLCCRAIRRAAKRVAPHVLLGIGEGSLVPPAGDVGVDADETEDPDEDVVDAEVVDEPEGDMPPKDMPTDVTGLVVDADWVRRLAIATREKAPDGIDGDDFRHALVWTATNGRTESPKDVRLDDEAARVTACFSGVLTGHAIVAPRPDGQPGWRIVEAGYGPGEEPFR